jgi:hypothetical protein
MTVVEFNPFRCDSVRQLRHLYVAGIWLPCVRVADDEVTHRIDADGVWIVRYAGGYWRGYVEDQFGYATFKSLKQALDWLCHDENKYDPSMQH